MMRSLFAGVTGLRTHQTRMDVLGNNISNVNTIGYKKSVSNFSDLYSDTVSSAQAPTGNTGSVNAKQIGLGVGMESIVTKHNQGAPQYTGNPLDCAITGEGYFVLRTAGGNMYSRAGDFKIGTTGFLENQNGSYVQGYGSRYQAGTIGAAEFKGLDKMDTSNLTNFTMTDHNDTYSTPAGTYRVEIDGTSGTFKTFKNGYETPTMGTIEFSWTEWNGTGAVPAGVYLDTSPATGNPPVVRGLTAGAGEDITVTMPGLGNLTFHAQATNDADDFMAVEDLYSQLAGALNKVDILVTNNDGFVPTNTLGDIQIDSRYYENVSITSEGQIVAQLKESGTPNGFAGAPNMAQGDRVVLGYIALATFANNEGLEKTSTNMFRQTAGSGLAQIKQVGQDGAGSLSVAALEMSNVEISDEMVSMITTQRGFQANSRIITTSDSMLEELVNLKR